MFSQEWLVWDLFHTASGTAFADIPINDHRETWPIRSNCFRGWLRQWHYEATGAAATAADIRSALDLLEARAQFDGPERAVHVRTAEHAERLYLDLADEDWRVVEIGRDGWRVITSPPVRFRRSAGMLPLPIPEQGGSIEALKSFLNLASRNDFVLILCWVLAALRPGGPYPLLAISGEQGSAKTVLSKLLKALIDPNAAPVRALSRQERELMIAAKNSHLLAFDNLSGLPAWLSDALCRLATGGSFAVRRLHRRGRGAVRSDPPDPHERHRGCHQPSRSGRSDDFPHSASNRRGATASGERTLAPVRDRAPAYLGRPARRGRARTARPKPHSS
jgi:hypothetical protein